MRKWSALFLAVMLAVPAHAGGAAPKKQPADCAVCGHVCCCPDVCAKIIKNRKSAAPSSGADAPAQDPCGVSEAQCRLGPLEGNPAFLREAGRPAEPLRGPTLAVRPVKADLSRFTDGCPFLPYRNIFSPVPVPPPRFQPLV